MATCVLTQVMICTSQWKRIVLCMLWEAASLLQTTDLVSVLPKAKSNIATCLKLHIKMRRTTPSLHPSGLEQYQGEHPDLGLRPTSELLAFQACNLPAGMCGMECVEEALLFERDEAMALHHQTAVRAWKQAPHEIMTAWTLRPQDAQEFHSCLVEHRLRRLHQLRRNQ